MCELFAMSSRRRAVVTFSLETFARRGGDTGHHGDGWGVAFFEGADARVLREGVKAATSPLVEFVKDHAIRSRIVISHIRKATVGRAALCNTQPFQRELGGRVHIFAHNGHLPGIAKATSRRFQPIGDADSEIAFCGLLDRLAPVWDAASEPPTLEARLAVVEQWASELRPLGPANFIYSDGISLFAHGHRRTQLDGSNRPPGLFVLTRTCCADPLLAGVSVRSAQPQQVVLFASVPLTDEAWRPIGDGEVLVAAGGVLS